MTSNTKRSLFGGALLSAGLTAGIANAQNFSFQNTLAESGAIEYATSTSDFDYFSGAGPFSIASSAYGNSDGFVGYGYGRIYGSSTAIDAFGQASNGGGYGYAVFSYFQVDQNVNAQVSWDFSGFDGTLTIYDVTGGFATIFNDGGNITGLTSLPLVAGNQYALQGYALAFDGTSNWHVAIPTPGAAGLLGIAGLVAGRRRR